MGTAGYPKECRALFGRDQLLITRDGKKKDPHQTNIPRKVRNRAHSARGKKNQEDTGLIGESRKNKWTFRFCTEKRTNPARLSRK